MIGNGSIADVAVVWARDTSDAAVKGFLIEKGAPGYHARVMQGKASLRAVRQTEIEQRLVRMLADVIAMQLYCVQIARLDTAGKLAPTLAGLAKLHNTGKARGY